MPVFRIPEDNLIFPHPSQASEDGLLGIGGDLSAERLILAYQNGIFPWNNDGEEIHWWCLTPRLILYPEAIKVSKSMKRVLRETTITVSFDQHFLEVMNKCSQIKRKSQMGTWIHDDLKEAFIKLHELGIVHSVEILKDGRLIGGLYGLAIGQMFCGESMFSEEPNMSKLALIKLCEKLVELDFKLIDCQQVTEHLLSMGGELMEKNDFFQFLEKNKLNNISIHSWKE